MRNLSAMLAAAALLAGCGGAGGNAAVDACSAELDAKLSGKSYKVDREDMAAKAATEGDVTSISSTVTFDAGLPSESSQTFDCKARMADGKAEVISFTFNF